MTETKSTDGFSLINSKPFHQSVTATPTRTRGRFRNTKLEHYIYQEHKYTKCKRLYKHYRLLRFFFKIRFRERAPQTVIPDSPANEYHAFNALINLTPDKWEQITSQN